MNLPYMPRTPRRGQQQVIQFGGVNYTQGAGDGEFSETLNLSTQRFPCLSQRRGRKVLRTDEGPQALYAARGKLLEVAGGNLFWDGKQIAAGLSQEPKRFATVNTKVCIIPDKIMVDTVAGTAQRMDQSVTATAAVWTDKSVKLAGTKDLSDLYSPGQTVTISGSSIAGNNKSIVIQAVTADTITTTDNAFRVQSETGTVAVERKVPDFDYICEGSNRLWGCEGQTIYASGLGDPLAYPMGDVISTVGYAVTVGSEGDFTGCASYGSNVLFFKENRLHKVLGSYPGDYAIKDYTVAGIQAGSEKSLVTINEVLYYKGRDGFYAYTGGTPELISQNFGERRFYNAVAGTDGGRYYVSVQDQAGAWELYTFDPQTGIWLRESLTHALDWAWHQGTLYYLDSDTGDVVMTGQDDGEEGRIPWSATLARMDETTHGRKCYSKLLLRCDLEARAWLKVEVAVDGGAFREVYILHNERERTVVVPIQPQRCDFFQVRLSGKGRCLVRSVVREFSVGSEY